MTQLTKSLTLTALGLGLAFTVLPAAAQEPVKKEKTGFSNGVGSNAADKPANDKGLVRRVIENARERGDLRREQRRETVDAVLENVKKRQDARQDRRADRKEDRINRRIARLKDRLN